MQRSGKDYHELTIGITFIVTGVVDVKKPFEQLTGYCIRNNRATENLTESANIQPAARELTVHVLLSRIKVSTNDAKVMLPV